MWYVLYSVDGVVLCGMHYIVWMVAHSRMAEIILQAIEDTSICIIRLG